MGKILTHEEFKNRINRIHPEIIFLTEYVNAKTRVKCYCNICKHTWNVLPDSLSQGCGCPNCANIRKRTQKLKTHESFTRELNAINPQIKVLGKYVNAKTKIRCLCLIDGYEWYATPDNLLRGYGCPKCAGRTKTTESFIQEMASINPFIEILGEYKTNNMKIKCFCKIHKYVFYSTSSHLLRRQGCKYCKSEKCRNARRLTQEEFANKLLMVNKDLEVVGVYIDSHTKVLVRCKKCNREWYVIPNNVFNRGVTCTCNKKNNISKGELLIFDTLSKYGIDFIYQHLFDGLVGINGGLLSYDFYLSEYNLLIEFQGEQHERPVEYFGGKESFKRQQEHDRRKREYAINNNISLLEIWYYDIDKIENIILDILNADTSKSA